jgi:hypothetical protein
MTHPSRLAPTPSRLDVQTSFVCGYQLLSFLAGRDFTFHEAWQEKSSAIQEHLGRLALPCSAHSCQLCGNGRMPNLALLDSQVYESLHALQESVQVKR